MAEENRERDLVLAPNEYAFISDQTKGNINVYVGPYKTSLANTDKPVVFNNQTKRFDRVSLDESTEIFMTAPEGWYIVMKNPSKDGHQPKTGTTNNLAELNVGRKVNIPGPINFALWPGQMAKVLRGHNLRSNQYLLVRVYDEEEAKKNWTKAVIKAKNPTEGEEPTTHEITEDAPDLTMGSMLLIKGANVSFYIPPTGVEVVQDDDGEYVREAVTLERLEYCILLDEDGNKRYIQGPAVVFPKPTEEFIYKNSSRKFKAIELNEMSGLYIKVIAPYTENKISYKEGDELFITGKDQMIYYPRPEHAIIKYGQKERHYSLAIPAGEGRYYLNRKTGKIALQKGPAMFLPDPREAVIVRRILNPKHVALWFPGNQEALEYNQTLMKLAKSEKQDYVQADDLLMEQEQQATSTLASALSERAKKKEKVSKEIVSDEFERDQSYTPPRTITLDTKYDGAVTINVWTGYAILVVSKTGSRKVITGPQTYLLEYDENLEAISLSTGTPKTAEKTLKMVYLRSLYNKVSDIVTAETSDYTQVSVHLSYRVNFEGNPEDWFNVENYVEFLTDHMRSFIRNAVKRYTVMDFYSKGIEILRDVILGKPAEDGKRPGRAFAENGMKIYDVEILDLRLSDVGIENLLIASQQDVVKQNLRIAAEKRKLEYTQESESVNQQIATIQSQSKQKTLDLQTTEVKKEMQLLLNKIEAEIQAKQKNLQANLTEQDTLNQINTAELSRSQAQADMEIAIDQRRLEHDLAELKGEVEAVVAKAQAVSPNLVAALQAFADKALAEKMAQSMSPLAILGGKSVADVLSNLLKGTVLSNVLARGVNGQEVDDEIE
jgi:major vault protein